MKACPECRGTGVLAIVYPLRDGSPMTRYEDCWTCRKTGRATKRPNPLATGTKWSLAIIGMAMLAPFILLAQFLRTFVRINI